MKPVNSQVTSQGGASKTVYKFTAQSVHSSVEGFDATSKRSGSKSSVERTVHRKHGRKRGARSTGRYHFLSTAFQYIDSTNGVLAKATLVEYGRRIKRMDKDFKTLVELKVISNHNPEKMTEKEILEYLKLLKALGLTPSGIKHNLDSLNSLLRYVGKGSMDKVRMRYAQSIPKRNAQMFDPIPEQDRNKIIEYANEVNDDDWQLMVSYGITVLGICTGLRPKEVRLANIDDLNLGRGTFYTEHVKGEGSYGQARTTAIHPDGIPFLRRYVRARAALITRFAPTCAALFPTIQDIKKGGDGYYSPNSLTRLRGKVIAQTGVKYDSRACRHTFGQASIDAGVPIDYVSRMMEHSSTKTTEKYYCRKTTESAISEAQSVGKCTEPRRDSQFKKSQKPPD